MLPGSQTTSMSGGDPSFMQQAVGAGLLGVGTYGGLTAGGANALVGDPTTAALIAGGLAIASLFD